MRCCTSFTDRAHCGACNISFMLWMPHAVLAKGLCMSYLPARYAAAAATAMPVSVAAQACIAAAQPL